MTPSLLITLQKQSNKTYICPSAFVMRNSVFPSPGVYLAVLNQSIPVTLNSSMADTPNPTTERSTPTPCPLAPSLSEMFWILVVS